MKYCFGPVSSRRLGISLGVDLMPHKTCSMNCVYCECGPTTVFTAEVREYTPTGDVIAELDEILASFPRLDAVTFSGSGEPTLHAGIGRVIAHLKERYPRYRVVVLTNGSLLWKPEVRRALLPADTVVPSIDAVSVDVFRAVNRPAPGLDPARVIRGLLDFSEEYHGDLVLEVFIVPGVNDTAHELSLIKDLCLRMRPRSVQLNTLDRPGTEPDVLPASGERMAYIKEYLAPLPVAVIGSPLYRPYEGIDAGDSIVATLRRRPSTGDDLAATLGMDRERIMEVLGSLMDRGVVIAEEGARGVFYRIKNGTA